MKYRDHRGSLAESMKTEMVVNSVQDIIDHLNEFYHQFGLSVAEIKFEYSCFDDRTGWDTYYVLFRLNGKNDFTVAGYSDGLFAPS